MRDYNEYYPNVVQVVPMDDYIVHVYFDDGKIVEYDASGLLDGEVFKPLRDPKAFKELCTVINGTLAWDVGGGRDPYKCVDIDPITLYELPMANDRLG